MLDVNLEDEGDSVLDLSHGRHILFQLVSASPANLVRAHAGGEVLNLDLAVAVHSVLPEVVAGVEVPIKAAP